MILFIEGPRHSGKTFLINQFLESQNDPRLEYYKFYFANHVRDLGLASLDQTPALHYFSLGNIMTIMEMNLREEYKDKVWIFDRAIISAYTWAIMRGRLPKDRSQTEFMNLISSELYKNSKTLLVTVDGQTGDSKRSKDLWDGAHSTDSEQSLMTEFLDLGLKKIADSKRGNSMSLVVNRFDEGSVNAFKMECCNLLGIKPNK